MNVGDVASRTKHVSRRDIELFTEITGDRNPLHSDDALAARSRFGGVIVQGGVTTGPSCSTGPRSSTGTRCSPSRHSRRAAPRGQTRRVSGTERNVPSSWISRTAGTGSASAKSRRSAYSGSPSVASTTHHDASSAMPFGSVK